MKNIVTVFSSLLLLANFAAAVEIPGGNAVVAVSLDDSVKNTANQILVSVPVAHINIEGTNNLASESLDILLPSKAYPAGSKIYCYVNGLYVVYQADANGWTQQKVIDLETGTDSAANAPANFPIGSTLWLETTSSQALIFGQEAEETSFAVATGKNLVGFGPRSFDGTEVAPNRFQDVIDGIMGETKTFNVYIPAGTDLQRYYCKKGKWYKYPIDGGSARILTDAVSLPVGQGFWIKK